MNAWNFDVDTLQENTTLYARWAAQTTQGGEEKCDDGRS